MSDDYSVELSRMQMMQFIHGYIPSQAIYVAAKLGLADLIGDVPRTVEELAHETKAHPPSLRRLLRALASLGIFAEDTNGNFSNTPLSLTLRADDPRSTRGAALMYSSPPAWASWGQLYESVMTGQPSFDRIHGAPFFKYLDAHPDDAAVFNAAMTSGSSVGASAIVSAYDFSKFRRIADVGGGHGALLHAILSATPKLQGVLVDLPTVVAGAASLRDGAVGNRCEIVGANFFESIPSGADAYVMKHVIHDWNDEDALKILRNCRRAMDPGGTLLLIEWVLKPSNEVDIGKLLDLNMLVNLGGLNRTEPEFQSLLRQAGFSLTRIIPAGPASIIESAAS
jgi:SAM-dependent methyltransferase